MRNYHHHRYTKINPKSADSYKVLLVDDEYLTLQTFEMTLHYGGIKNTLRCQDSRKVMSILDSEPVAVAVIDLMMPFVSGQELLKMIGEEYPEIPVIIVTGTNELEIAVECMKDGAFDYMVKPVEDSRLCSGIKRALELRELVQENIALKDQILSDTLNHPEAFSDIITASPSMNSIFQYIEAIAMTSKPVLITGETGVGKELIARSIHRLSGRKGNFVAVNISGFDDQTFADTLFGHKKGAFTGADTARKGLIREAREGTLFLDEIGELSSNSQVKLLRLLQENEFYPLGEDEPVKTDARVLAATNLDPLEIQDSEHFRPDLYYRLLTHHIHVPPLRERQMDLPLLIDFFLEKSAKSLDKKKPTPPDELYALLSTYHFPGNIRELESMIFDAVSYHQSKKLSLDLFKKRIFGDENVKIIKKFDHEKIFQELDQLPSIKEASQKLIHEALRRTGGNQTMASKLLGISQPSLSKRLKRINGDGLT